MCIPLIGGEGTVFCYIFFTREMEELGVAVIFFGCKSPNAQITQFIVYIKSKIDERNISAVELLLLKVFSIFKSI